MIHAESVSELARVFGSVPAGMAQGLREELPEIGRRVERRSQANSAWSRRIPAAHYVRVSVSQSGGVTVGVDAQAAPHARPYEGLSSGGRRGTFRHPNWGRDDWSEERTRPFLRPAADAERPDAEEAIRQLVRRVTAL